MKKITISNNVQKFPGIGGWYFIPLSVEQSNKLPQESRGPYGFLPVTVMLQKSVWRTSLLPGGKTLEHRYFIALKTSIRKKEGIGLGDGVKLTLTFDE